MHTGCWLRETRIPLNCVDLMEIKTIFAIPKGGENRTFSIPMFEQMVKAKLKCMLKFPFQPSRRCQQIFIVIKKPHLTFHCLRGDLRQPAALGGRAARMGLKMRDANQASLEEMRLLPTVVFSESQDRFSPALLSPAALPKGQQSSQPAALARPARQPQRQRPRQRSGTGSPLAASPAAILETRFPQAPPKQDCATER